MKRSRWRTFGLRSFLIVVTLTSVAIGYFLTTVQPMLRQWESVDRFVKVGARIQTRPSELPPLIKRFLPADRNSDITVMSLKHRDNVDEAMKGLRHLTHLDRLYLPGLKIEDEDLVGISKLTKLRRLALWRNSITDASVGELASLPNLEVIDIKHTQMTWRSLLQFKQQPNLQVRHNFEFATSCAELETLAQLNERPDRLTLEDYSPGAVAKAFELFPNLKRFTHRKSERFTADDFQVILEVSKHSRCRFYLEGETVSNSLERLMAAQIRPRQVDFYSIEGKQAIGFELGKGYCNLMSLGDFPIIQQPDFFAEATQLDFKNSAVRDFQLLSGAKKLKAIEILGCQQLTEITGIPGPLESVSVAYCDSLKRFTGWDNSSLRYLSLHKCPQLDGFASLHKFPLLFFTAASEEATQSLFHQQQEPKKP